MRIPRYTRFARSSLLGFVCALAIASSSLPGQARTVLDSTPALHAFASDSELVGYLRHLVALTQAAQITDDSVEAVVCGSDVKVLRTAHYGDGADAVIRAHLRSSAGAPLFSASLIVEKSSVGTMSNEAGDASLTIPAAKLPANHTVTLGARLVGFKARLSHLKIFPGDTITMEISLCSQALQLQQLVVTGAALDKASAVGEQTTNDQSEGVDEGDLVKLAGRYLVILRRGRLFTVDVGSRDADRHTLRPRASIDAFGPDINPSRTWYDELIVRGDRVVVIGYSYERRGTEIGLFRLARNGALRFEGTYQLRSYDYYSSRNYASRLLGGKLVFYAPLPFGTDLDGPSSTFPALRRWHAGATDADFHRITRASQVYSARDDLTTGEQLMLHAVTSCDLDSPGFSCTAQVVIGPPNRNFYVSPTSVYIWATREGSHRDTSFARAAGSTLYRLPFDDSRPTGIRVAGSPHDQLSFAEGDDGYLNVVVCPVGRGESMWHAEQTHGASAALLRIPLAEFGDGSRHAARSRYRLLPTDSAEVSQNRFVGDWLLYGAGNGWWSPNKTPSATLFAVRVAGGDAVRLALPHGVDRIDVMGRDAIVIGTSGDDLHFTGVDLTADPRVKQQYVLAQASQGELRTHGFFYKPADSETGVLGLPVQGAGRAGWVHLIEGSTSVLYLRNSGASLTELGALSSRVGTSESQEADACKASCVDWYGNARPLFAHGRVFALLGYELVEGRIEDGELIESRRVDFAPRARTAASRKTSAIPHPPYNPFATASSNF